MLRPAGCVGPWRRCEVGVDLAPSMREGGHMGVVRVFAAGGVTVLLCRLMTLFSWFRGSAAG